MTHLTRASAQSTGTALMTIKIWRPGNCPYSGNSGCRRKAAAPTTFPHTRVSLANPRAAVEQQLTIRVFTGLTLLDTHSEHRRRPDANGGRPNPEGGGKGASKDQL